MVEICCDITSTSTTGDFRRLGECKWIALLLPVKLASSAEGRPNDLARAPWATSTISGLPPSADRDVNRPYRDAPRLDPATHVRELLTDIVKATME